MHETFSSRKHYMLRALNLARMHNPSPNPAVGAVIVKDGKVIAEAAHRRAGDEHAEAAAVRLAGRGAVGATLYVTLEPCCHSGAGKRRPPCTGAVIDSGISRVIAASADPNPRVSGGGFKILRSAGIDVSYGLLSETEAELNRAYRHFQKSGMPWVHLKQAVSLDGFISKNEYGRTVLSCPESLERVHALRASHQAILVGGETAIRDRPALTVRNGYESKLPNPVRIVVEGSAPVPPENPVFDRNGSPVYLFTGNPDSARLDKIAYSGIAVVRTAGRPNMRDVLRKTGELGIISVLAEAGGGLSSSLLGGDLVDEISLFYSPMLIGKGTAMNAAGSCMLDDSEWKLSGPEVLGRDVLLNWKRRRGSGECLPV